MADLRPRWKETWECPWAGVNGTRGLCGSEWSQRAGNRKDVCIRGRRSLTFAVKRKGDPGKLCETRFSLAIVRPSEGLTRKCTDLLNF